MPGGRPSVYDPAMCNVLDELGYEGEGIAEAAAKLGISKQTLYNWQERHPEFLDAVKAMTDRSQAWWEKNGRKATFGEVPGFNATSFIFNMKNRFGEDWRDKQEVENKHDVSDGFAKLLGLAAAESSRIGIGPDDTDH